MTTAELLAIVAEHLETPAHDPDERPLCSLVLADALEEEGHLEAAAHLRKGQRLFALKHGQDYELLWGYDDVDLDKHVKQIIREWSMYRLQHFYGSILPNSGGSLPALADDVCATTGLQRVEINKQTCVMSALSTERDRRGQRTRREARQAEGER